jgi:hypothetical protein
VSMLEFFFFFFIIIIIFFKKKSGTEKNSSLPLVSPESVTGKLKFFDVQFVESIFLVV